MPQATKTTARSATALPRLPRPTLNSDGERHPVENSLAVFTLAAGLVAAVTGFMVAQHVVASVLGAAGLAVGLFAQMISATRAERMIIVTGLVAAFLGLALGLGHGGFVP
ncbi:MAG TPA: hypothetical protein VGS19_38180 [Streptosporangiaceae bacterium]|nr:hypothetical protein [Streptosporangiaceae bacterium]